VKLKDALEDAVADTTVDVPRLAWEARRVGLAHRRRRRALAVAGVAVTVAVASGATWVAVTGSDGHTAHDPTFVAAPVQVPDGLSGRTGPLTGRGAVAALVASVDAVTGSSGRFADFEGNAGSEPMAVFLFTSDDSAEGLVHLNLQSLDGPTGDYVGQPPYTCDQSFMEDCHVTELPGGDTLRTYVDRVSGSDPGYRRNVAELISPERRMRFVLGATTTSQSEKEVVRSDPPLTLGQLSEIATQPWWTLDTLPVEYLDQGEQLPSYRSSSTSASITG